MEYGDFIKECAMRNLAAMFANPNMKADTIDCPEEKALEAAETLAHLIFEDRCWVWENGPTKMTWEDRRKNQEFYENFAKTMKHMFNQ